MSINLRNQNKIEYTAIANLRTARHLRRLPRPNKDS